MANIQRSKRPNSVTCDRDQIAKNTNVPCHQLNMPNAKLNFEIKWILHLVLSMVRDCMVRLRKKSIRFVCSVAAKSIFGLVHDAMNRARLVFCIPLYWENIIALQPFCPTKIHPGAMPFYFSKRDVLWSLKCNTSPTTNFYPSFWANKLWTKKVYGTFHLFRFQMISVFKCRFLYLQNGERKAL